MLKFEKLILLKMIDFLIFQFFLFDRFAQSQFLLLDEILNKKYRHYSFFFYF